MVSRRTGSKRTRSGEEEVEDTREEVGEAERKEEFVALQLKRSRRMSPSLLVTTEEGHVSDSSSSGVYSDGF